MSSNRTISPIGLLFRMLINGIHMKRIVLFFVSLCISCLLQANNYLCFTSMDDNSSVGMQAVSYTDTFPELNAEVFYSVDEGVSWNVMKPRTMITLKKGKKMYFYGENPNGFSEEGGWNQFLIKGSIAASGSVMSLVDAKGVSVKIPNQDCFGRLFMDCEGLTQAPELPATSLTAHCYNSMFYRCSKLVNAPELPAKNLAESCYRDMFCQCSKLAEAPVLPATTLKKDCYLNMFSNCVSLTQAPALPAMTLTEHCYHYMFNGCKSLTEAPELPATTLAPYCYTFMFENCVGMKQAPALPAKELAEGCYRGMFEGCVSLTEAPSLSAMDLADYCYWEMFYGCSGLKTAPYLPAVEIKTWSYYQMFQLCSNLSQVQVALPSWSSVGNNTYCWLDGVASTGKFVCPIELEEKTGASYIPGGWDMVHSNSVNDCFVEIQGFLFSRDGHLYVSASREGTAYISNLSGQAVKSIFYESGETDLGAFPAGVYVVNGRKVVVE